MCRGCGASDGRWITKINSRLMSKTCRGSLFVTLRKLQSNFTCCSSLLLHCFFICCRQNTLLLNKQKVVLAYLLPPSPSRRRELCAACDDVLRLLLIAGWEIADLFPSPTYPSFISLCFPSLDPVIHTWMCLPALSELSLGCRAVSLSAGLRTGAKEAKEREKFTADF